MAATEAEHPSEPADLAARIDRLYALPLADFVSARDDLARALRSSGERGAASAVKELRKPSSTAWAVNQLVHHHPQEWSDLLRTTQEIRRAHATGPQALAAAIEARKAALAAAVRTAEAVLSRAGGKVGASQIRRIAGSLEALASGAASVRPGRLVRDLEPPGFGGLTGLELAAPPRPVEHPEVSRGSTKRPSRARRAPARARPPGALGDGGETSAGDARRAEERENAVRRMREALERASERAASAARGLDAASEALADAERQADEADATTRAARAEAAAAQARLLEAQAAQARLERRRKKLAEEVVAARRLVERAQAELAAAEAVLSGVESSSRGR